MINKNILIFTFIFISSFLIGNFINASTYQDADGNVYQCSDGNTYQDADGNVYQCSDGNIDTTNTTNENSNNNITELDNPLGTTSVPEIVGRTIKAFLGIIGTISLIIFIYAGFILLTSKGSPDKIKTGQSAIVWASLGILLVFAAYAILKFVFNVIGI
jgi:hypothetical protein